VLGFYVRLEDMSSPRSETEWINLFIGHRTLHPAESGDRAELSSASAEPYLPRKDRGYLWGSGGGETTLSERLPCGHTGAFHGSGAVPSEGGSFEGRMQDGTVTTERSPVGWARSAVHRPGTIPGWVQVYTLCRVARSIAIAASSVMDTA
jgi:hypothetical protein